MVVIKIEDANGHKTLGSIRVEDDETGMFENVETNNIEFDVETGVEFDDTFSSNDFQLRVFLQTSSAFNTLNHDNVGHVPKKCQQLVKEYNSYKWLLKYYYDKNYYDCFILIKNYFGHIDYWAEFGYMKTHDEICCILFECLLSSLQYDNDRFEDFVNRMMKKITWNLKEIHNYEIEGE